MHKTYSTEQFQEATKSLKDIVLSIPNIYTITGDWKPESAINNGDPVLCLRVDVNEIDFIIIEVSITDTGFEPFALVNVIRVMRANAENSIASHSVLGTYNIYPDRYTSIPRIVEKFLTINLPDINDI